VEEAVGMTFGSAIYESDITRRRQEAVEVACLIYLLAGISFEKAKEDSKDDGGTLE
jgi:hypothetical protein